MPLVYANHTIHHGKGLIQQPGAVFSLEVDEKDLGELLAREAVRLPTEDEVKLHKLANGDLEGLGVAPAAPAAAPAPAEKAPAKAADTKADATESKGSADDHIG